MKSGAKPFKTAGLPAVRCYQLLHAVDRDQKPQMLKTILGKILREGGVADPDQFTLHVEGGTAGITGHDRRVHRKILFRIDAPEQIPLRFHPPAGTVAEGLPIGRVPDQKDLFPQRKSVGIAERHACSLIIRQLNDGDIVSVSTVGRVAAGASSVLS